MDDNGREKMVEALRCAGVPAERSGLLGAYLAGGSDVLLSDIEMDSLAVMELCIWLELNCGLSLAPDEVGRMRSLDEIVRLWRQQS